MRKVNHKNIGRRCTEINTRIAALRQIQSNANQNSKFGAGNMKQISDFYMDNDRNSQKLRQDLCTGFGEKRLENSISRKAAKINSDWQVIPKTPTATGQRKSSG